MLENNKLCKRINMVLLHFVKNLLLHSRNLRINQGAIRHNRSLALTFIPFSAAGKEVSFRMDPRVKRVRITAPHIPGINPDKAGNPAAIPPEASGDRNSG